ncbi:dopamine N-acetyltransferase-like [Melanaphis sacchari]|uniref:dopamine N-acetyltransferase-like n=1 Tax=Melanaphis sacchari TaxID=742174 RepID=UPI000DC1313F|nr:dopamine N-acetyltransferase-like [Melanaphis sacchari]XP_025198951.1 dopamine N-acetyltransferase-like [Melanaphis sacchari]XP_025198961.1 dopamine N-acetyltransferase-like [Melanaphis sacchari]
MSDVNKYSHNIVPTTAEDKQVVIDFLRKFFFRDEPLILGINMREDYDSLAKLENYCFNFMDNGLAFKAVSPNGDLIGVVLNNVMHREDGEKNNESEEDIKDNTKFSVITTFLDKVEREADVFKKYPSIDRVMDIKIISVDESFRGQGVCKALIDKTIELALENKCPMVYIECSSYFSAKAAERLGFECIYTSYFRDYLDENGKVIFKTLPPHDSSKVYVLHL